MHLGTVPTVGGASATQRQHPPDGERVRRAEHPFCAVAEQHPQHEVVHVGSVVRESSARILESVQRAGPVVFGVVVLYGRSIWGLGEDFRDSRTDSAL